MNFHKYKVEPGQPY